jgi:hypothetical protein
VPAKIFVSRVRYGVIRPCGPQANLNSAGDCAPVSQPTVAFSRTAEKKVRLAWPKAADGFSLEATTSLALAKWVKVPEIPTVEGDQIVCELNPSETTFYRLTK